MKMFVAALAFSALMIPALAAPAFADDDHGNGRGDRHDGPGDHRDGPGDNKNNNNNRGGKPNFGNNSHNTTVVRPAPQRQQAHRNNGPQRRVDSRDWKGWHGDRDIRAFRSNDYNTWRKGHWYRGNHNGRSGVWWIVGSIFYPYAAQTAAIPDPYVPADMVAEYGDNDNYWYYCADPEGYYPYVAQCYTPWRAVPQ